MVMRNRGLSRRFWFRLAALGTGMLLTGIVAVIGFTIYVQWCRATGHSVSREFTRFKIVSRLYADESFIDLLAVISKNKSETFKTIWDYDRNTRLSKDLFLASEMYGQRKYRYKPDARVVNAAVWSGLNVQKFSFAASDEIRERLGQCRSIAMTEFQIDEHGCKPTEFEATADKPSIFFLGDSFTEGLFTSPEDTFVNLFGRRMREDGFDGAPVNMGVNGYSALEMCWVAEQFISTWRPVGVIANLFPNDVHERYIEVIRGEGSHDKGYEEMFGYLERLRGQCGESGAKLIVSVIPAKEQLTISPTPTAFQDRVGAWCEKADIMFIDPLEHFGQFGVDRLYLAWDPHFSVGGHEVYARWLFERCWPVLRDTSLAAGERLNRTRSDASATDVSISAGFH